MRRIKSIGIIIFVAFVALSAVRTFYRSDPKNLHYHPYQFTEKEGLTLTVAKFIRAVERGNTRNAYRLLSKSEGSYKKAYSITKSYCRFSQGMLLASLKLIKADIEGSRAELTYQISPQGVHHRLDSESRTEIDQVVLVRFNLIKERDVWRISPSSGIFNYLAKNTNADERVRQR